MPIRACIFDVFGSLVDWRGSVARHVAGVAARKGVTLDAIAVATDWRAEYQPGMARVRDGARGYVPLEVLHLENFDRVLDQHGLSGAFDATDRITLNQAWERLDPWADVPEGLAMVRAQRLVAPCSNGSIAMMTRLARHGGLVWDAIVGADIARDYKPKPEVYHASARALGLAPSEVMMIAAHNDDLAAARDAGLSTGFFPRPTEHGPDQSTDLTAEQDWDVVAHDLKDLAQRLTDRT
ncbi:2-haloacid dehalogenase [Rubricella aquisinus]|uniref:(S)-2-haloacid dehalogenase n=1 Tax=Rubricella aquisinus TaxID=2028108 RepID=A0A840WZ19_9RHOB|nr:haloacid dehalogenase type II [Rubricella aquisinus]MBB5515664.1 2-haloacid dehalogenase [Rubricella aquisinus]